MSEQVLPLLIDSFPKILLPGILITLPLAAISFSFALIIGTAIAMVQHANVPVLAKLARPYIWLMRGTPLLIQLYVVFYGLPDMGITLDPIPTALLVFSLNTGAYSAETIRASIESVLTGQMDAARSFGMPYLTAMRFIVLPQAMRMAFPPLSNELISLVKDTSLAANITVLEMFMATQRIVSRTFVALPLYLEVACIYLIFSTALEYLQRAGEKRLAYGPCQPMKRGESHD